MDQAPPIPAYLADPAFLAKAEAAFRDLDTAKDAIKPEVRIGSTKWTTPWKSCFKPAK